MNVAEGIVMNKSLFMVCVLLPACGVAQVMHQQRPQDSRTAQQFQADCAAGLSLSACGTIPVSKDCAAGAHWALDGLNYAHCVPDALNCPPGTRPDHDLQGNSSCVTISCPVGQSLVQGSCVQDSPPPAPVSALPAPDFDGLAFGAYSSAGASLAALNIPVGTGYAKMNLILNTGNGSWTYSSSATIHPAGCCSPVSTPLSGIWTVMPSATYQYRISSVTYGQFNPSFPAGQAYNVYDTKNYWTGVTPFPAAATEWLTLPANTLVSIGGINMNLVNGCSYVADVNFPLSLHFTLQLRNAAQPGLISTSGFDLVLHFTNNSSC